jgi:protein kinase A
MLLILIMGVGFSLFKLQNQNRNEVVYGPDLSRSAAQREKDFLNRIQTNFGNCAITDFELGKVLGKGSSGTVRHAKHIGSGKVFAIKILSVDNEADQNDATRERNLMISFDLHPNIVRLEASCKETHSLYLIQEFGEGGDVFVLLRKMRRFNNQCAQFFIAQTVSLCQEKNIFGFSCF